jgi:hypothetical protein
MSKARKTLWMLLGFVGALLVVAIGYLIYLRATTPIPQ